MPNNKTKCAEAKMLIRKPVEEVFEAFMNPAIAKNFWFTKSSGRLEVDKEITWTWEMYNVSTTVIAREILRDQKILFEWDNPPRTVEFNFKELDDESTYVTVSECGFEKKGDELMAAIKDSTGGFTTVLDGLKAFLEFGINLNLIADKFPKEIPGIEDRLRNRFEWGLIADIQPPDMETRVAILQKKAENEGVQLPHDVAFFLASNIDSNVRELEGSLTRLGAFSSLTKATITVELAKDVLKNTLKNAQQEITVENIQKTICDYFNLKIGDLKAKRRTQNIALPRQVAMYLCRKYTETSFPAIGDKFGGRDHSTVIHASKTIERKIKEDPHMQTTIEKLERNLNIRKRV